MLPLKKNANALRLAAVLYVTCVFYFVYFWIRCMSVNTFGDDKAWIIDFVYNKNSPSSRRTRVAQRIPKRATFIGCSIASRRSVSIHPPSPNRRLEHVNAMKGVCCCFSNSVRSLILILSFACIVSLFSNVLLLNFAVIYKEELLPPHYMLVTEYGAATIAPNISTVNRLKRDFNETQDYDDGGVPIAEDTAVTDELISAVYKADKPMLTKVPPENEEGHPVAADDSLEKAIASATFAPTTINTRRVIFSNPTDAPDVVDYEDETTATPSPATKRHAKDPVLTDKDLDSALGEDGAKTIQGRQLPATDYSQFAFFDRLWMGELSDWLFFAAPGIGMLLLHFPTVILIKRLGCRLVLFVALIVSALSTLAVPFLIESGASALVILRLLQGMAFAPVFSFIGQNAASWASLKEQLWFLCTCIAALILSPAISWSFSNEIFSHDGFNSVFYIHGVAALVLAAVFLLFYRDTPQKHRWVNGLELNKVVSGKAQKNRLSEMNSTSMVFKSIAAVSIWIAAFGYFFAFAVYCIFLPVYSNNVLHLTPYSAGSFATIPFLLMAFVHWISYLMNRFSNCCGLTAKVRVFNTLALALCSLYFVGLAIVAALHGKEEYSTFNTIVHYGALLPLGFAINGFLQSSVVVGRYYTQLIVSNFQLVFSAAFILVPAVVVLWTPLNLLRYWRLVFLITAAVLIMTTLFFVFFGRGQPPTWAENSWDPTATHRMLTRSTITKNAECGIIEMRTVDDSA